MKRKSKNNNNFFFFKGTFGYGLGWKNGYQRVQYCLQINKFETSRLSNSINATANFGAKFKGLF